MALSPCTYDPIKFDRRFKVLPGLQTHDTSYFLT